MNRVRAWVRVAALSLVVLGVLAEPVAADTVPGPVRKIQVEVDDDEIKVKWDRPRDDGGTKVRDYEVRIGDLTVRTEKDEVKIDPPPAGTYRAQIRARNDVGWGPWASSRPFDIQGKEPPSAPRNVTLEVRNGDNLRLRFDEPASDGGDRIREYRVRYGDRVASLGTDRSRTIARNVPDGTYRVEVSARNRWGWGPWASSNEVRVGPEPAPPPPEPLPPPEPAPPPEPRIGPFRSAEDFVVQQYRDLFDRPADSAGVEFWMSQLDEDGSNAPRVIATMMATPEFAPNYQAIRLYLAYFNRLPDNAGLNYWVSVLKSQPGSLNRVSSAFAGSTEFATTYGPLNDAEFVALVYNNVLLRTADDAGFSYWVRQLGAGLTRGELMVLFSDSPEFVEASSPAVLTVAIYNAMLDRSPTSAEFQRWIAEIGADSSAATALIAQTFTGADYAARVD